MNVLTCDRCNQAVKESDQMARDEIDISYKGVCICNECYLLIELQKSLIQTDLIRNLKPGTTLKLMLERYESNHSR
jgi:hypothetical protein